jgi:hypothetical protein
MFALASPQEKDKVKSQESIVKIFWAVEWVTLDILEHEKYDTWVNPMDN